MNKILSILYFLCSSFAISCSASPRLNNIRIYNYSKEIEVIGSGIEAGESNVIKKLIKPGDIVFDVGANIGEWSNHVFSDVGDDVVIYAFEPIKSVYNQLQVNVKNKNFITFNEALSNTIGSKTFYFYQSLPVMSGFYDRDIIRYMEPQKIVVNVDTLDLVCSQNKVFHIDFLKIDTEGEELNVLRGAQSLLEHNSISMIQFEYGGCYIDAKTTLKQVYNLLVGGCHYSLFRIKSDGLIRIPEWKDELENYGYANYLAVLEE